MWNTNSYKCTEICAKNSYGQLCQQSYVATWVYWHISSNYSSDIWVPLTGQHPGQLSGWPTPLSRPAFKNDQWIINWKRFEILSQHLSKRTEGNYGKSQSWQLVFSMISECRFSWIMGRIDTPSTTTISFPISHK